MFTLATPVFNSKSCARQFRFFFQLTIPGNNSDCGNNKHSNGRTAGASSTTPLAQLTFAQVAASDGTSQSRPEPPSKTPTEATPENSSAQKSAQQNEKKLQRVAPRKSSNANTLAATTPAAALVSSTKRTKAPALPKPTRTPSRDPHAPRQHHSRVSLQEIFSKQRQHCAECNSEARWGRKGPAAMSA